MDLISLFCPFSKKYESFKYFDRELTLNKQIITIVLAALASLILPVFGTVAVFRAMVEKYRFEKMEDEPEVTVKNKARSTAKRVKDAAVALTIEGKVDRALLLFSIKEHNEKTKGVIRELFSRFPASEYHFIANIIKCPPMDERSSVLSAALKLEKTDVQEFNQLISMLTALTQEERQIISECPFANVIKSDQFKPLLKIVKKLSIDELREAYDLTPLRAESLIYFQMILGIERKDRKELLSDAMPLLGNIANLSLVPEILNSLKHFESAERKEAIDLAVPFAGTLDDPHTIAMILKSISGIEKGQRSLLVELIMNFLDGMEGGQILRILEAIRQFPPAERLHMVQCALPHSHENSSLQDKLLILEVLREGGFDFEPDEIEKKVALLKTVSELFSSITDPKERKQVLDMLKKFPPHQRTHVLQIIAPHVKGSPAAEIGQLFNALYLIAPDCRSQAFGLIPAGLNSWVRMMETVFVADPTIMQATHEHLKKMLDEITERERAFDLAKAICDNSRLFGIMEGVPLFDRARDMVIMYGPDIADDDNSPFNVYAKLVRLKAKPTPKVDVPIQKLGNVSVALSPAGFEVKSKGKKILFDHLPKNVNAQSPTALFNQLETRVASLGAEVRQFVEAYIQNSTGGSLQGLKFSFCEDDYLKRLISFKGNPQDEVPREVFRFFSIISYIFSLPDDVALNDSLSPREDALVKISASIQNCPTGKTDGIANVFNALPHEFRNGASPADNPVIEQCFDYVDEVVQLSLQNILAGDTPFMRELTGLKQASGQHVHDVLHLKNLIGQRIGYRHDIKFDPYSGCITHKLRTCELNVALELYYKHIKPEVFVERLIKEYQKDQHEFNNLAVNGGKKSPYSKFEELYNQLNKEREKKGMEKLSLPTLWDSEDDYFDSFIMTDQAAVQILMAAGYLKEV